MQAEALAEFAPQAKLLLLLRDPVERLWSDFFYFAHRPVGLPAAALNPVCLLTTAPKQERDVALPSNLSDVNASHFDEFVTDGLQRLAVCAQEEPQGVRRPTADREARACAYGSSMRPGRQTLCLDWAAGCLRWCHTDRDGVLRTIPGGAARSFPAEPVASGDVERMEQRQAQLAGPHVYPHWVATAERGGSLVSGDECAVTDSLPPRPKRSD